MKAIQGGNLPRVKLSNQVAIRKMIYHYGPITRADVSKRLNLTLPTITTNVSSMLAEGILVEVAPSVTDGKIMGRPANPVNIAADHAYFIGVEMRGARRQLCITDMRGKVLYEASSEDASEDYNISLHSACKLIREALDANIVPRDKIAGIGFCTPGMVDSDTGTLIVHPGYNWVDKTLRQDLVRLTDYHGPITIHNNARARANSALMFQPDLLKGANSFAYMLISTGIACPFIMKTDVATPVALGAGEVGHMVLDPLGPKCSCGNRGCLETFASDSAIIQSCVTAIRNGEAPILADLCKGAAPTLEQILQAQEAGEAAIGNIVQRALYYLGLAIANIYNFIRPDVLLIEGKLFANPKNRQAILEVVNANLYSTIHDANFRFVDFDIRSGAIGAAATAILQYLEDVPN